MISIEEAKKIIDDNLPEPRVELIDVQDSLGMALAEAVYSPLNMPAFTNSAMDGFAVNWEEVKTCDNELVKLKIIGESAAGVPFKGIRENNSAVRINTGSLMPADFDTVVPIENVELENNHVVINSVKKKNQNVRYEGEEFKVGDLLLNKDTVVNPAVIALLAGTGIKKIKVYDKVKITLIVTGSELTDSNSVLKESQIYESNSIMLASLFKQIGCKIECVFKVRDSLQETEKILSKAESISDIIILSGGVSVGPHDHVKEASANNGFKELFWKVNQKPGKPLFFARKNNVLLFGVPGNPVSAIMCALYYILPAVIKLSGRKLANICHDAAAVKSIKNKQDRSHFMRAIITNQNVSITEVEALDKQASHMMSSITDGDGFIVVEPNQEIKMNETIKFYPFPWRSKWVL